MIYKHLLQLQPKNVPLLSGVMRCDSNVINEIKRNYPGIPEDYLQFLKDIGYGEWKDELGFAPYYFFPHPIDADKDHFKDGLIYVNDEDNPGAIGQVLLFACDSTGAGFGFDSGDNWCLVEIDTTRSVKRLGLDFFHFIEGLLICYPLTPERYSDGKWFDSGGDSYVL